MKTSNPLTTCPSCKGTGKIILSIGLQNTLALFKTAKQRFTAQELYDADPTATQTSNAINNRLERLRKDGFLKREKLGRLWTYKLAPKEKNGATAPEPSPAVTTSASKFSEEASAAKAKAKPRPAAKATSPKPAKAKSPKKPKV